MARLNTRKTEQESPRVIPESLWEITKVEPYYNLTNGRRFISITLKDQEEKATATKYYKHFREIYNITKLPCHIKIAAEQELPRPLAGAMAAATQLGFLFNNIKSYSGFSQKLIDFYIKQGPDDERLRYCKKGVDYYYKATNKAAESKEIWEKAVMLFLQVRGCIPVESNKTSIDLNYKVQPISYSNGRFVWKVIYSGDVGEWEDHIAFSMRELWTTIKKIDVLKKDEQFNTARSGVLKYFYKRSAADYQGKWLTPESRRAVEVYLQDFCDFCKEEAENYDIMDDGLVNEFLSKESLCFKSSLFYEEFTVESYVEGEERIEELSKEVKELLDNCGENGVARKTLEKYIRPTAVQKLCKQKILIKSPNNRGWILNKVTS